MENKKQAIILSVIASIALLVLIVGATYAYFQASGGTGTNVDVKVTTYTTDVFNFEVGNDISIYADATSFASGKGNASGSTFAKAILTANNKTNTATEHYYLYLNISNNTFLYTQNESTPELLLTITDASGNAVTDITSLTYKTVTDGKGASIKGYDITNKSGLITLFNNKEITASPTKTDEWNITVTLVNYDKDQSKNAGKSFSAKLMIQKKKIPTVLSDVCTSGTSLQSCISKLSNLSEPSLVNIYRHTSSLANGASDGSYRYAGASDSVNNYICLGSDATPCPDANLFRIIGAFRSKTKVIRAKSVGDKEWDTNNLNTWSSSSLNTYLNGEYLTSLGTLADKIATTTWKVGGGTPVNISSSVPKTAYQYEVRSSASSTTYDAKIGLMYVTDYYYSASPSAWTLVGYNESDETKDYRAATSANWLFLGSTEWTISRFSDNNIRAFYVNSSGNVFVNFTANRYEVRPSFNLEASVNYVSGSGSMSDPVRVTY